MEKAALIRAILDDPDDETLRLAFADWLQEHGEEARAEWIRASCALARSRYDQPDFGALAGRVRESLARCRPAWWENLTGVLEDDVRGMFRLRVRSKAAVNRIRKAKWLSRAFEDGWLEWIAVDWSDGPLAREVAKWPAEVLALPLFARPAPQIDDDGLAFYLRVPGLTGLELPAHAARNPSVRLLGERPDLRELRLGGVSPDGTADVTFEQVVRLFGLRRLTVRGYQRPSDDDLLLLGNLTRLRELHLDGCSALTDRVLDSLRGLSELRTLRVSGCPGISARGLAALMTALPALNFADS